MTITKTNIGTDERTNRPLYHYASDGIVVLTGPLTGRVRTSDGVVYDITEPVIEVQSEEHAGEVVHHIGVRLEAEGHPSHTDGTPFLHLCTPRCGTLARPMSHPLQAAAAARAAIQAQGVPDPVHAHEVGVAFGLADGPPPTSMALASAVAENAALNGLDGTGSTNVIPDVSLHTASPGTTGANENANTGSYVRQACSWNAASTGAKTNSSSLTFTTGGSVAVSHVGTWSSATYGAGNYAIGGALGSSVTAASITIAPGALTISAS